MPAAALPSRPAPAPPEDAAADAAAPDAGAPDTVAQETAAAGGAEQPDGAAGTGFSLTLENFSGPFEVLLNLISKHELDITEVALAAVTDEFIAYIRRLGDSGSAAALDETTEFLVVAATLLDLKAARLLPAGQVEDETDIELLEARDLLFARLLQYKAFKEVAGLIGDRLAEEGRRFPRLVTLEPRFAALLPELVWKTSPDQLAALAEKALTPRQPAPTEVGLAHLHAPPVSVREQAEILAARLAADGTLSFTDLVSDATGLETVARFLALLEMFRDGAVRFDQEAPLGELRISWTAGDGAGWSAASLSEEYGDEPVLEDTDAPDS
ncbi:Segregation and condensation protein A [Arthrobacter saudimassiliensis]|uniref:Segregation and condensation protein A n=1 Tax=Arthrobacter saudimassiliensis TaxID=1461584 RepID=A0A078MN96_9MICC|nr:Segregation and condensation protein A [Arthrobacter saudimassiliensis]